MAGTRAAKAAAAGARTSRTTRTRSSGRAVKPAGRPITLPGSDEPVYIRDTLKDDALALLMGDLTGAEDGRDTRAMSAALNGILHNVFTPESMLKVKQRITDPDDSLTFKDVLKAMEKAMEDAAGRPTGSSRT